MEIIVFLMLWLHKWVRECYLYRFLLTYAGIPVD